MGYIYLITNKINNMRYVGQTYEKDIHTRWNSHKSKSKYSLGRYILAAYNKYGVENFTFQIICICFDEDCNRFEEEYIQKFNTLSPNGYNLKSGGNNSKHHPDTIKLISERLKGRRLLQITPEIRKKLSEGMKGERNPNFGKEITTEQKKKLSDICKKNHKEGKYDGRNKNLSEKCLQALERGRGVFRKKVGKYDDQGNLIEVYLSMTEAGNKNNISYQQISKVCSGKDNYKTAGGFKWKYVQ